VESIAGPREYDLELPFYLDPPARAELARRGVPPDSRSFERLHFLLQSKLRDRQVENIDSLNEVLARELGKRAIDEIPYAPRNDWERAQELCFQAFDAWGRRQGELVERALALDPECIDALVLKAERTPDSGDKRRWYEAAVASGEKLLDSDELPEDVEGNFWTYYPTRPYLRALHGLAHVLDESGESTSAIERSRHLLSLDQEDHQQVRYCLLGSLLKSGRFRDASRHIKRYESPGECLWAYARALAAFGVHGDKDASRKALDRAFQENPFAAALLLRMDLGEPDPETEADAAECDRELSKAWSMTEGALDWLEDRFESEGP
jgi:tetratricopeptide (TPR) repeat protein